MSGPSHARAAAVPLCRAVAYMARRGRMERWRVPTERPVVIWPFVFAAAVGKGAQLMPYMPH